MHFSPRANSAQTRLLELEARITCGCVVSQKSAAKSAPQSDELAFQVCQPEAQVSQGDGAPNRHEVPSSEPVCTMVPTALQRYLGQDVVPQIAQRAAGVGQLGAAQVDLAVCHHAHEFEDLLPAARRPARWGSPQRQGTAAAAPDRLVAVVGYAEAVRGPIQRAERGVYPVQVAAPVCRDEDQAVSYDRVYQVVPQVPCTGIFLGPSKSGKTVLISMILEQYRGVFEKIYIFSPSVNIDDGWIPVKKYIEEDLGVMFHMRFEERFALEREADGSGASWARSCSQAPR